MNYWIDSLKIKNKKGANIMKRKNLLKILILFILVGSLANAEYIKRNGEIYYREWSEEKPKILKNIDKK